MSTDKKLDYEDYNWIIGNLPETINKQSKLVEKIIKDRGSFFFGIVTPSGTQIKLSVGKNFSDEEED